MNLNIRKIKKIKAFSIIYIWSQSLIMFKKMQSINNIVHFSVWKYFEMVDASHLFVL